MNKDTAISTSFYIGWLYVFEVNKFINNLINNHGLNISYEQKIGFFENKFTIFGSQKDVYSVSAYIEKWFNEMT